MVQDSNPVKASAIAEAQKRYEAELAFKAELHARNMANHSKKIAKDTEQFEMELMSKYQKKKLFNDNIKEQIKQNVSNHVLTL